MNADCNCRLAEQQELRWPDVATPAVADAMCESDVHSFMQSARRYRNEVVQRCILAPYASAAQMATPPISIGDLQKSEALADLTCTHSVLTSPPACSHAAPITAPHA